MSFPAMRPRRLRVSEAMRRLVRETTLEPSDFIYPVFVCEGRDQQEAIASLPGQYRWSVDRLPEALRQTVAGGLPAVMLFGVTNRKDAQASEAVNPDGPVPRAIKALKDA